jgi:DNA-directed RNA polymerase specialized sigma subunit
MPARKTADAEVSVDTKVNPALPGKEVRELKDVAFEIRRLRFEEGLTTTEIQEKLQVSLDIINQLLLQSYKMTMNTFEVMENQEKLRLGLG